MTFSTLFIVFSDTIYIYLIHSIYKIYCIQALHAVRMALNERESSSVWEFSVFYLASILSFKFLCLSILLYTLAMFSCLLTSWKMSSYCEPDVSSPTITWPQERRWAWVSSSGQKEHIRFGSCMVFKLHLTSTILVLSLKSVCFSSFVIFVLERYFCQAQSKLQLGWTELAV